MILYSLPMIYFLLENSDKEMNMWNFSLSIPGNWLTYTFGDNSAGIAIGLLDVSPQEKGKRVPTERKKWVDVQVEEEEGRGSTGGSNR